jgi:hypothetical protein
MLNPESERDLLGLWTIITILLRLLCNFHCVYNSMILQFMSRDIYLLSRDWEEKETYGKIAHSTVILFTTYNKTQGHFDVIILRTICLKTC